MKRDLSFYLTKQTIVNNDIRYINKEPIIKNELKNAVSWANTDDVSELLYLYRNNFTEYPKCEICSKSLVHSFVNGKRGYRRWCSKSCYKNSQEWKDRIVKTSQLRYGTNHPLSSSIVQMKRKQTNIKKYGISNPMHWSGDLFKDKMIEKYNVVNPRFVPEIEEKIKNSINKRNEELFRKKLITHLSSLEITPIDNILLEDRFKSYQFKHSCGETINSSLDRLHKIRCFNCHKPKNMSQFQYELETFVKNLGFSNIVRNDRNIISPRELDILIPEKRLAIEAHGDYWHSDLFVAPNTHQIKCNSAEDKYLSLIQIFESEWITKKDIICSMISAKLGISKSVYARKLSIVKLSMDEEVKFFNENHLQGYAKSNICLGLYDGNQILCACSFNKPRFNKKYDWELIRFASRLNHKVLGGAGKLLNHFAKDHQNENIISYADRRFSNGNLYETLGFKLVNKTTPNYWYINFKTGQKLSRYQTQKKKLKKLFPNQFIQELTETENMIYNGFRQIFDAGNLVYEMKL